MRERENFYPENNNLGNECMFWSIDFGCTFPKTEMEGRRSCEGIIDDICLYFKDRRRPRSLSEEQILELKTRIPNDPLDFPPGDIKA